MKNKRVAGSAGVHCIDEEEATEIYFEYLREYEAAIEYNGIQIWASIRRCNGDPRWYYAPNEAGFTAEFCS